MKKIAFIMFDQFQILDVTGPAQIFNGVNELSTKPIYDIHYLSVKGGLCHSTCGISINTTPLIDLTGYDSMIISGGQGSKQACEDQQLIAYVAQQATHVRRIVSICTGTFILSQAGVIDGKRVTTHWAYADQLQRKNPTLQVEPDALFIRQGNVITSAGVTAGMDLVLALIEDDVGKKIAKEVARYLVFFYRRPGGQSQFSAFQMVEGTEDDLFGKICLEIINNPNRDYRIAILADKVNMTERTFLRRFTQDMGMSPTKFVEKSRMDYARRALEETKLNLDQIAYSSGFQSAEVLRRTFHRHMAISPKEYRERFGG